MTVCAKSTEQKKSLSSKVKEVFSSHLPDSLFLPNSFNSSSLYTKPLANSFNYSKAQRLKQFALSVLNDPEHCAELAALMQKLNLSVEEVIEDYIKYNDDMYAFDNGIYSSRAIRMVLHIHNLLKGSWHIERQDTIEKLVKIAQPKTLVDVGFGCPTNYIKNILQDSYSSIHVTLNDFSEFAFTFAKALLSSWSPFWEKSVRFKKSDMEDTVNNFVGHYDLYIFLDSIEHVLDPTQCLKNYVSFSLSHSKFLFSLPIGPLVPVHHISWDTNNEAEMWLNKCGLKILKGYDVAVNPNVDIFAEQFNYDLHNYIVLCSKI